MHYKFFNVAKQASVWNILTYGLHESVLRCGVELIHHRLLGRLGRSQVKWNSLAIHATVTLLLIPEAAEWNSFYLLPFHWGQPNSCQLGNGHFPEDLHGYLHMHLKSFHLY